MTINLRRLPLALLALLPVPACQHDEPIVGHWTLKTLDGHQPHESVTFELEIGDDLHGTLDLVLENDVDEAPSRTRFTVDADDAPNYVLELDEYDGVTEMLCHLNGDELACSSENGWGAPVFTRA